MAIVVDVATLGSHSWASEGGDPGDTAGWSVADAGDFNGDGFADVIIGARFDDTGGTNSGAAYLLFGRPGGFGDIDFGDIAASDGFMIAGGGSRQNAGTSVSGAGDVNGDGFDDIIVEAGTPGLLGYGYGSKTFVIFGRASTSATIDLSGNLSPSSGFLINGPFGMGISTVSDAGDVNADGYDDIIIASSIGDSERAYVIFGKPTGFGTIDVNNLGTAGFAVTSTTRMFSIADSASSAGDFNGDGFDDIIVSAQDASGFYTYDARNLAFVVYGHDGAFGTVDLGFLPSSAGLRLQGVFTYHTGALSVSGAGDVNGDGLDDVIVGSSYGDRPGAAYVVFGTDEDPDTLDLAAFPTGFRIHGGTTGTLGRFSVSAAGDVNGDGFDDVLVGVPHDEQADSRAGDTYLIFGHAGSFTAIDLANLSPSAGVVFQGHSVSDLAGLSVSAAGDVNDDGYDDFIIGAPGVDEGGVEAGAAYVIFGQHAPQTISSTGNDVLYGTFGNDALTGLAGNDFLDGGAGADMLDGGADNDRIVYDPSDNPAQVSGGTGTDTLVVMNMFAPTAFNLGSHGFEAAEVTQRDPGGHSWSSIVSGFNANWMMANIHILNDDSSHSYANFDIGNAEAWNAAWYIFDTQGRLANHDIRYDNGARGWSNLDVDNSQTWTQAWFTFDAQGRLTSQETRNDDGTRVWGAIDAADAQAWDQAWYGFDALDRTSSLEVRYDDNSRSWTGFDANGSQAWSSVSYIYDPTGHLYQQVVAWDDGSTTITPL